MSSSIVWFRQDLRLHDHRALAAAIDQSESIIPVYVADERFLGQTSFGFDRIGPHRLRFLRESLENLQASLKSRGSYLVVKTGRAENILPELANQYGASSVHCHHEYADEEKNIEQSVSSSLGDHGVKFTVHSANTLIEPDDLPFDIEEMPAVFTKFRKKVEKSWLVRAPLDAPDRIKSPDQELPEPSGVESIRHLFSGASKNIDDRSAYKFCGGEEEGLKRIDEYLWQRDCLKNYKETRNGMLGEDYSSKFSPWLANGSLSPRVIYREVKRYEQQRTKNDSTYWLIFELLWRDFFAFTVAKYGRSVFLRGGLRGERLTWSQDRDLFNVWTAGQTGYPLVDANMRELSATGFMSNRGRQNVASFLVKNLGIDWRMGAQWFESLLLDYDPCSNYGNWNYVAGVGNDPRQFRWFNITGQSKRYDKRGQYVKHWCPELNPIPGELVHQPWELTNQQQRQYRLTIGDDYPNPIVDLERSARLEEERYLSVIG